MPIRVCSSKLQVLFPKHLAQVCAVGMNVHKNRPRGNIHRNTREKLTVGFMQLVSKCIVTAKFSVTICQQKQLIFPTDRYGEILEKLQHARSQIKAGVESHPILSHPGPVKIKVGNWVLTCNKEGELHIHNPAANSIVQQVG